MGTHAYSHGSTCTCTWAYMHMHMGAHVVYICIYEVLTFDVEMSSYIWSMSSSISMSSEIEPNVGRA